MKHPWQSKFDTQENDPPAGGWMFCRRHLPKESLWDLRGIWPKHKIINI